jgi:SAM-dependent methyltransferase
MNKSFDLILQSVDKRRMTNTPHTPSAPALFDQKAIRLRLQRAMRHGPADFLLARVADDLVDRLAVLTKRFPDALDWASCGPHGAEVLATSDRVDQVVRASFVADPAGFAAGFSPWHSVVADGGLLPFGQQSFDLAASLLGLQIVDDLPGALVQLRRVLRPDGLLIGCLLGGETLTELRQVMAAAEIDCEGGLSPRVAPFVDLRDMGGLLQRAGFALPVTDSDQVTVRYKDIFGLIADLRAMGATNPLLARQRQPMNKTTLLRASELYQQRFSDPDGRIRASFEIIWFSGWVPHESQQKPLKPGSAQIRLADALKQAQEI